MQRMMLLSKIHLATVTEADVDYVGSISIDEDLMDAAGVLEYEQVHVAGLTNGERLVTYVIKAPRGSRTIGMNGAAALLIKKGERIIIFSYGMVEEASARVLQPRIVFVDENNRITSVADHEIQGTRIH